MKKIFRIVLLAVVSVLLSSAVCAADIPAITYTASPNRQSIKNYDAAFAVMYEAVANGQERADLSEFSLSIDDTLALYSDIIASVPEFFYLDNKITYYYKRDSFRETVTEVKFVYKMSGAELEEAIAEYEKELAYIVSQVDMSLSDAEKALWVHDYIAAAFEYDERQAFFDVYSLFRERKGVCQAYSLAYIAVLRELGMEAVMVISQEMNHAWNLVKIDGEWYHVDIVYDDPSPDRLGRVMHDNFLLDDRAIAETQDPHYGWESSIACDSSAYTDAVWHDVSSRMVFVDGQWYYIDGATNTLAVSDIEGKYRSDVFRFEDKWYVEGNSGRYWVGMFTGVSDILGHVIVNTPYEIMIHSPKTGTTNVYIDAEKDERIFGSNVYKNTLEYLVSDRPDSPPDDENRRIGTYAITDFSFDDLGEQFPFDDVSRLDEYYASIRYVYRRGLFKGVSSTKFAPKATLTRAMFVTVLGRLCGINADDFTESLFTDVDAGLWYTPYVEWAAENGIVEGIGGNLFDPTGEITHEQMIEIVARLGVKLMLGDTDPSDAIILFDDRAEISDWALDGTAYCADNKLIKTDGIFAPSEYSTRAEAAEIVARFALMYGA